MLIATISKTVQFLVKGLTLINYEFEGKPNPDGKSRNAIAKDLSFMNHGKTRSIIDAKLAKGVWHSSRALSRLPLGDIPKGYLYDAYIFTEFRRRGYFRSMLNTAVKFLQDNGIEPVKISVRPDNLASTGCVEKAGFYPKKVTIRYWSFKEIIHSVLTSIPQRIRCVHLEFDVEE